MAFQQELTTPSRLVTLDRKPLWNCAVRKSALLLESLIPDATDHQLNVSIGGATAIVVRPPGKAARYTLSIGLFNREGELSELDLKGIDESIKEIEEVVVITIDKVRSAKLGRK